MPVEDRISSTSKKTSTNFEHQGDIMKTHISGHCIVGAAAVLLFLLPSTSFTQDKPVTDQTLLEQIRIQDMMVRYYADLGKATGEKMARHYTEDGVLDVNNMVFTGRNEIEKIYSMTGEKTGEVHKGTVHTLVTNVIIDVDGNEASCWLIYTNVQNESIEKPPKFLEQGRDHTKLVKRDGRWLIKHRWITSDGGTPKYWRQKYIKR
jgi:ketosteroid isomerase-like protein